MKLKFRNIFTIAVVLFCIIIVFIVLSKSAKSSQRNSFELSESDFSVVSDEASESYKQTHLFQRVESLIQKLEALEDNNYRIRSILRRVNLVTKNVNQLNLEKESSEGVPELVEVRPPIPYEETRRILEIHLKEIWYTLRSLEDHIPAQNFTQLQDIYRVLRSHVINLRANDGYELFRQKETTELANLVQGRIKLLQNPVNCDTARKAVCKLNKPCGFGCQIHHVGYCLIHAYATGRTLILETEFWKYDSAGWNHVFLPVSDTCTDSGKNQPQHADVIEIPYVDSITTLPNHLPVSIPADICRRLERVHGEPHIWWVGQFIRYLLRLQPSFQNEIKEYVEKLRFQSPTVGIHVRRTDKITYEASFHSLEEYMVHAREYFDIQEKVRGQIIRNVFIASDDPAVISEAKTNYSKPGWRILGSMEVARTAKSERYGLSGLIGVLKDVFVLAECDFLICTFSSQICRLAYELVQAKHADASGRFVSLDSIYYYGGGNSVIEVAVIAHTPRDPQEIELRLMDNIHVDGNHWNGMSKGMNLRTYKRGFYPSYKTRNLVQRVAFPKAKWWLGPSETK
ncbi:unnamed protein product [Allacma fusca]|uniref:GT23 domain-containing protein n=1 Tax=Allacma fusca TaxID=39272 RepID=A0A8J2PF98_9HEXA|nr:unnamed protein product [Allacma fusca]